MRLETQFALSLAILFVTRIAWRPRHKLSRLVIASRYLRGAAHSVASWIVFRVRLICEACLRFRYSLVHAAARVLGMCPGDGNGDREGDGEDPELRLSRRTRREIRVWQRSIG